MRLPIKNKLSLLSLLTLGVVFYNEVFVYWKASLNWPELHLNPLFTHKNGSKIEQIDHRPVRLLLVADPQLIGEQDEPWYLSWLAQWDCDRYLKSTFTIAYKYTQPDAVVYLGDLFDEGLKATDEQFERYYKRFKSIFRAEKSKQIYISGDNDVGGEYFGDRNIRLVQRFEKYFGPNVDLIELNPAFKFLKIDVDYTVSFYNGEKREKSRKMLKKNDMDKKFTIILNHMSLLRIPRQHLNDLIKDSNARLIIKADSHLFDIIKFNHVTQRVEEYINYKQNPSNLYVFDINQDRSGLETVYELSIPTCSYRMGVPNMGYGVLTLTTEGKAYVSILWLPSRFYSIRVYVVYLIIVGLGLVFYIFIQKFKGRRSYFLMSDKKS